MLERWSVPSIWMNFNWILMSNFLNFRSGRLSLGIFATHSIKSTWIMSRILKKMRWEGIGITLRYSLTSNWGTFSWVLTVIYEIQWLYINFQVNISLRTTEKHKPNSHLFFKETLNLCRPIPGQMYFLKSLFFDGKNSDDNMVVNFDLKCPYTAVSIARL